MVKKLSSLQKKFLTCPLVTLLLVFMQAIYSNCGNRVYILGMPGGRPPKYERTEFGERLYQLRLEKGFSQQQIAERVEVTQQAYAGWERSTTALRPLDIAKLAAALEVSSDELLGLKSIPKRKGGPLGRAHRLFEKVSSLSRKQQQKVLDSVELMIGN
jgi:transcriptional regulator with XRE-family HTH domain